MHPGCRLSHSIRACTRPSDRCTARCLSRPPGTVNGGFTWRTGWLSPHITEKVNKAYTILGIIKRNFRHVDKDAFVLLYKALVRSHLKYANTVWSPYKQYLIEEVEKVQKRATKLVHECKYLPYTERLKYLNFPTLKYRRQRGDMIQAYKTRMWADAQRDGHPAEYRWRPLHAKVQ